MHRNPGIDLINTIKLEKPAALTDRSRTRSRRCRSSGGVELESNTTPPDTTLRGVPWPQRHPVQGIPALHRQPPLPAIGSTQLFDKAENPFPWMSEMIDLKKERNFGRDPG